MKKTIVIFGSSMGTCQGIAEKIAEKLDVEAINVGDLTADVLNENENLLLGRGRETARRGWLKRQNGGHFRLRRLQFQRRHVLRRNGRAV